MTAVLFDTNMLLDIATADATWLGWSEGQFRAVAAQGPILINPIIYAELAPRSLRSLISTGGSTQRCFSGCRYLTLPVGSRRRRS